MTCNEDCTLVFGEVTGNRDILTLKQFFAKMRAGLSKTDRRRYRIDVVHYKFVSRNGDIVVDKVKTVDISVLFDFNSRESSCSTLYTHHGLVASDLLLLLKEEQKWDGYCLEVGLQGVVLEGTDEGLLEVA